MSKKTVETKTYLMVYLCRNCDRKFGQRCEFGEVATQGQCPHCGVSPLQLLSTRLKWEQVYNGNSSRHEDNYEDD